MIQIYFIQCPDDGTFTGWDLNSCSLSFTEWNRVVWSFLKPLVCIWSHLEFSCYSNSIASKMKQMYLEGRETLSSGHWFKTFSKKEGRLIDPLCPSYPSCGFGFHPSVRPSFAISLILSNQIWSGTNFHSSVFPLGRLWKMKYKWRGQRWHLRQASIKWWVRA